MAWGLIAVGVAFGIGLVLCGARAPMLIAVGMYLPFDTSSAIFLGGALKYLADKFKANEDKGLLIASGLVSGEAIVGILLAVTYLAGIPSFTKVLTGADQLSFFESTGGWLSLLGFAAIAFVLVIMPRRRQPRH
jgi:hypothetical protein